MIEFLKVLVLGFLVLVLLYSTYLVMYYIGTIGLGLRFPTPIYLPF